MVRSRWKSRKNKKRAHSKRRAFIRSYARPEKVPRPQMSSVGKALSKIATRMGDRGV